MLYNRSRLLKLELWLRRLSWLLLFGAIFSALLVVFVIMVIITNQPEYLGRYGPDINNWTKSLNVISAFRALLYYIFLFLAFLGMAKLIRYLLTLRDKLFKRNVLRNQRKTKIS